MVEILGCTKKVSLLLLDICAAGTSWAASFLSLFSTLQFEEISSFYDIPWVRSITQGSSFC